MIVRQTNNQSSIHVKLLLLLMSVAVFTVYCKGIIGTVDLCVCMHACMWQKWNVHTVCWEQWKVTPRWRSIQAIRSNKIPGNSKGLGAMGFKCPKRSKTWKSTKNMLKRRNLVEITPPLRKMGLQRWLVTSKVIPAIEFRPVSCMHSENWLKMPLKANSSTFLGNHCHLVFCWRLKWNWK
jgi:hypothetical protein